MTAAEPNRVAAQRELVRGAVVDIQEGREVEAAYRLLFDAYFRPLCRFFARKGFDADESLDLTQETFLRIYKSVGAFRHDSRFDTWLYQVARNVFLKRLRNRSRLKRSGQEIMHESLPETEAGLAVESDALVAVIEKEEKEALHQAVRSLPEKMRQCLTLRLYQQLSYNEIATVMKLELGTVKAHLFQARQKLGLQLDPEPQAASHTAGGDGR